MRRYQTGDLEAKNSVLRGIFAASMNRRHDRRKMNKQLYRKKIGQIKLLQLMETVELEEHVGTF